MTSNSQIFTSTVYGNNSGTTASEISFKITEIQEEYLQQISVGKLSNQLPRVPSLQKTIKGK